MKKIKTALLALAIIAGVGSAFAMKIKTGPECYDVPQYYQSGSGYVRLNGFLGYDYDCDWNEATTCTYYEFDPIYHPGQYGACHTGALTLYPPNN